MDNLEREIISMDKPKKPYSDLPVWRKQEIHSEFYDTVVIKDLDESGTYMSTEETQKKYKVFLEDLYNQPN